jgi:hypothetical protein
MKKEWLRRKTQQDIPALNPQKGQVTPCRQGARESSLELGALQLAQDRGQCSQTRQYLIKLKGPLNHLKRNCAQRFKNQCCHFLVE